METKITDLQRIARIFKLKEDDTHLVLKIQDIIKAKDSEIKKKKFSNDILWAKNKQREAEINNLHNEFAESIGIAEHMRVKKSGEVTKKELNKALEEAHKLRETIRKYQEREFKDRLKQIERVR